MESATATSRPASRPLAGTFGGGVALAAWVALVVVAWAWGTAINEAGANMGLSAPPFHGFWDLRVSPALALPLLFAVLSVTFAPALSRSLSWARLLVATAIGSLCWALALALSAGPAGVFDPLAQPTEYLAAVSAVSSPGEFLGTFTERIGEYPTHVRGHPPGMVLGFWALDQIGLGGAAFAALFVVAIAASSIVAALLAARAVASEEWARRAAPFLVLAPGAVWIATSADALYMGVGAWAVALTVLAIEARGRRSTWLALAGGALFALCAFLSYGLVLLGLVPAAVAVVRGRLGPIFVVARVVGAVVLVVWLATGFWWLEGLVAVREQYLAGVAPERPYEYFLVSNMAVFAMVAGPALALALTRARLSAAWALPLGALAAVLAADLSGMSKGEVERIWLPFLPWALLATGSLPGRQTRPLLAATAALAIAIQAGVRVPW